MFVLTMFYILYWVFIVVIIVTIIITFAVLETKARAGSLLLS